VFETITILLALSAIFSFVNERYLKFETTIGLMFLAFLFSIGITWLSYLGIDIHHSRFMAMVKDIDFSQIVLQGVLCFLLFAGAKNVSLSKLEEYKWDVFTLAIIATFVATFLIGYFLYFTFQVISIKLNYIHALIFGAIISPTDPVAALSILKNVGLPNSLEVIIDGESEFNDGIGVVIFVSLLSIAIGESSLQIGAVTTLFLREVLGGIAIGLIMGLITHYFIINSKTTITQVLISLSSVSSGYAIAEFTGVSGPIGSVVLGLIFGNISLAKVKSKLTREHIDVFWSLVNQILNAVLFVLIGLIVLQVNIPGGYFISGILISIVIVLLGRFISVYLSMFILGIEHKFNFSSRLHISTLLTWVGMRGALAVALVLSLPDKPFKSFLIPLVYGVVVFSILVQGGSIKILFPQEKLKKLVAENR